MVFKKLIKEGHLNVYKMLLKDYVSLGLNETELVLLMHLFNMLERNKTLLSINQLTKNLTIDENQTAELLDALMSKGFLSIDIEISKDGKEKETFNLDLTLEKLSLRYAESVGQTEKKKTDDSLTRLVELFEKEMGRSLSYKEISTLTNWVDENIAFDKIKSALLEAIKVKKKSIEYVDGILFHQRQDQELPKNEIDPETRRAFDDFFKGIKR